MKPPRFDGCSDVGYLIKIVLPLAKSSVAVLFLVYAVAQWNQYFLSLVYKPILTLPHCKLSAAFT